ncbi:MAG: hypothetical protein GY809_32520 [Planctomycetes bacterium]|nr:hypothetical protein [Planctomycetota bacterium]
MRTSTIALVICLSATLGSGNHTSANPDPVESGAQAKEALRVFFIGNSHTGCNSLMKVVQALRSEAEIEMVTAGHIVGGCTLERHWNEGKAVAKMTTDRWDVVILQENGQGPLAYPDKMRQYAGLFDEKIKQVGAKTAFFMTAAYQDHPETTKTLVETHLKLGKELNADVAPVGLAFADALMKRANLTLHNLPDTVHANRRGTYLTACVIWSTLTGNKPHGLSRGGLTELSDEELTFLQEMAWASILEYQEMSRNNGR